LIGTDSCTSGGEWDPGPVDWIASHLSRTASRMMWAPRPLRPEADTNITES
jgi:hypothetical protein